MYEYKVETYNISVAEEKMNALAKAGWRAIATTVTANNNFIVTYERKKQ